MGGGDVHVDGRLRCATTVGRAPSAVGYPRTRKERRGERGAAKGIPGFAEAGVAAPDRLRAYGDRDVGEFPAPVRPAGGGDQAIFEHGSRARAAGVYPAT